MSGHGRIPEDVRRQIQSCFGVYLSGDVARHFGVARLSVLRIWEREPDTEDIEPPNIDRTRLTDELIAADLPVLMLWRGFGITQCAQHFGVPNDRIKRVMETHGKAGIHGAQRIF